MVEARGDGLCSIVSSWSHAVNRWWGQSISSLSSPQHTMGPQTHAHNTRTTHTRIHTHTNTHTHAPILFKHTHFCLWSLSHTHAHARTLQDSLQGQALELQALRSRAKVQQLQDALNTAATAATAAAAAVADGGSAASPPGSGSENGWEVVDSDSSLCV